MLSGRTGSPVGGGRTGDLRVGHPGSDFQTEPFEQLSSSGKIKIGLLKFIWCGVLTVNRY